jgi:streptogramin lyase
VRPGNLVFQVGKQQTGYLFSDSASGLNELSSRYVCEGAYGANAVSGTTVFAPCTDGIAAVSVQSSSFTVLWHGPQTWCGTPVIAGGLVWTVEADTGTIDGLDPASGAVKVQQTSDPVVHFATPAVAGGMLFVATAQHRIDAYVMSSG